MNIDFTFAPWGMTYAALMFVIGNGIWTNYLVRQKPWAGWLMWSVSALPVVVAGAAIQLRLGGGDGVWAIISSTSTESHWIIVTLYALLSIPGLPASCSGKAWNGPVLPSWPQPCCCLSRLEPSSTIRPATTWP